MSTLIRQLKTTALSFSSLLVTALGARAALANEVTDWHAQAVVLVGAQNPMDQSRSLAVVQVAVHDALNAIDSRYRHYAYDGDVPNASAAAAVASATFTALNAVLTAPSPELQAAYTAALAAIPDCAEKTQGVQLGRDAAQQIVQQRKSDDLIAALTKPYVPGDDPGDYRATPPDNAVFGAGWGELTPFVAQRSSLFRPLPPPSVTGKRYAKDYIEIQSLGVQSGSTRTADQTQIADFWYESSSTGWHRIANKVVRAEGLDNWQSARVFGLVGLALVDGFITGFDAKYHYNYWRPLTGIREGDHDGNRRTQGDSNWTPYCATPPVADYPSTHALLGGAASAVLARALGDRTAFTADSLSLPGVSRSFERFSAAARENADSRVYCGIHWRTTVDAGLDQGRKLGDYVFAHALKPKRWR